MTIDWLSGKARNVHSQFGEDGLIESVFSRIGSTNQWCFEVGAADGLLYSNTKAFTDVGWHGVLIEKDESQYLKCVDNRPECNVVLTDVTKRGIDEILRMVGAPADIDLGVIDIDGQDYWAWNAMQRVRPRVMLVEYAYWNDPGHLIDPRSTDSRDQSGLSAIVSLGVDKGYLHVATTHCNALFVRKDALSE